VRAERPDAGRFGSVFGLNFPSRNRVPTAAPREPADARGKRKKGEREKRDQRGVNHSFASH